MIGWTGVTIQLTSHTIAQLKQKIAHIYGMNYSVTCFLLESRIYSLFYQFHNFLNVTQSNLHPTLSPSSQDANLGAYNSFNGMALYPQSPTSVPRAPKPPISQEDAPLPRMHLCALQEPYPQPIIPPGILLELTESYIHLWGPLTNRNSPYANLRSGYMVPCASSSSTPCLICFLCILWCPWLHLYTSCLHDYLGLNLPCS